MYLDEIKDCAAKGNARAMDHVAQQYWMDAWNGQNVQLEEKARALWQRLADNGDARGEYGVGFIYLSGLGVKKDCDKAVSYLTKSADQNNSDALFALGHVYLNKECVPRNIAHARMLFSKAAVLGNIHAQAMVENIDSCPSNPQHYLQPCHD
jgi:TPR repeat protein